MKTILFALAAGLVAATASAATATPAGNAAQAGLSVRAQHAAGVEKTDYRDRRRMLHRRDRDRDFDWDDDRYRPYRGWHRYHSRPWGWRNRGCVAVGPIWFCP